MSHPPTPHRRPTAPGTAARRLGRAAGAARPAVLRPVRVPGVRPAAARITAASLALLATAATAAGAAPSPACRADTGLQRHTLVELYTSEGCSSCPPADRWLRGIGGPGDPHTVALAFHVDYWDGLGWPDRFAAAHWSQRQAAVNARSGARFNYTPQVLADGHDWRFWPRLPADADAGAAPAPAPARLQAEQLDGRLTLTATPAAGAPARVRAWLAEVDDGLQTAVRAGENRGELLRHDHVVRQLAEGRVQAFAGPVQWTWPTATPTEPGARRHWVLVLADTELDKPLQALRVDCP